MEELESENSSQLIITIISARLDLYPSRYFPNSQTSVSWHINYSLLHSTHVCVSVCLCVFVCVWGGGALSVFVLQGYVIAETTIGKENVFSFPIVH